jgi:TolC family type I secretion outer membrane protein
LQVIVNQPVENLALLEAKRMDLLPPVPASLDEWIARGEENNAELRALQANIEVARAEVDKAKAGHYPTVDLFAQRSISDSDSNSTINDTYYTNTVGMQFNIPLWSGGGVSSQIRQAAANLQKVKQQYEARRREVSQQVRKEFQNVTEGIAKVKALEQAERSADQAVFSNQKGFQAGTRSQVDILNAQHQRMNVRRDLAQARYLYMMARVRLQGLVNSLNEDEIKLINSWLKEPGGHHALSPLRLQMTNLSPVLIKEQIELVNSWMKEPESPHARYPLRLKIANISPVLIKAQID